MSELKQGVFPATQKDPYADDANQPFWDAALKGKLVCSRCDNCGTFIMSPQPRCFVCQHKDFTFVELPGTGVIYTYTVVRHPLRPNLAEVVPYVSAIVELDGTQGAGARMQLNVVNCDPDKVRIGDKVKIFFDKASDTLAVPRCEPA